MKKFSLKKISIFFTIILVFFTSSCFKITYKLWHAHDYIEDFQQFFISQDRKFVIFIGEKFHYVFSDYSEILEKILSLEDRKYLFIDSDESFIEIDKYNNLNGYIVFDVFKQNLNPSLEFFLHELGFYKNPDGMTKRFLIKGKRYHFHEQFIKYLTSFDQKYPISIRIKLNKSEDFIATALTPIAITIDGILELEKIILNPFYD